MHSFIFETSWRITMVFGSLIGKLIVVAAQCPTGCSECSGSEKCFGCLERYRLESTTCVHCPDRCLNCSADNTCQRCQTPYYGMFYPHCNKTCSVNCDLRGCDTLNGLCFGCQDKYYGARCDKSCNLCKNGECDMYSCMDGCTSGFYERKLTDTESECLRCIDNCRNCTDSANCFQCVDGYVAVNYHLCFACSNYIHNCALCSYNSSLVCKACQEGYYLQNNECVEYICPNTCQGNCSSGGTCVGGCIEGFSGTRCENFCASRCQSCALQDPNMCTNCTGDFYTSSCFVPCSSKCIIINGQSTCSFTGNCINGCLDGYWRSECNQMCPVNCNKCEQFSGACWPCKPAFYGQFCEKLCSSNCLYTDQSAAICSGSGDCLQGCKLGFTGSHCNIRALSTVTDDFTTTPYIHEDSNREERTNDDLNNAVIGGATAGCVVVVGMLIGIGVLFLKRRSRWPHSTNSMYVNTSMAVIDNPRNKDNGGSGRAVELSINPSLYETLTQTGATGEYSVLPSQNAEVLDTPSGGNSPTIYYNIT